MTPPCSQRSSTTTAPNGAAVVTLLLRRFAEHGAAAVVDETGDSLPRAAALDLVCAIRTAAGDSPAVVHLRCDSDLAWQSSVIRALRGAGFSEASARSAELPQCGLLRLVNQSPHTIFWIDGDVESMPGRDLLSRLRQGRLLLTGVRREALQRLAIDVEAVEYHPATTPPPWDASRASGLLGDTAHRSLESASAAVRLLTLWSCIDEQVHDAGLLRAACGLGTTAESYDAALQSLRELGCVQAALDGGWRLDPALRRTLPQVIPVEWRLQSLQRWAVVSRDWSTAAEPEVHALHADSLAKFRDADVSAGSAALDAVVLARELCHRVGAWRRAAECGQRVIQRLEASADASAADRAAAWLALSAAQRGGNQWLDARRSARRAEDLLDKAPDHVRLTIDCKCEIAEIDLAESRAERAYQRLESVRSEVTHADMDRARQARWLYLHGACLLAGKQLARSEQALRRGLELRDQLLPADHEALLSHRSLLARNLFAQQKWPEAEELLQTDLRIRRESSQVSPPETALAANLLAELYFVQGRYAAAEPLFAEVFAVRQMTLPEDDRLMGETAARLAGLKASRGDYAGADPLFRQALHITEAAFGGEHPRVAEILNDLARMLFTQSRYDQSRRLLERALQIQQQSLRRTDPRIAETRNNLAAVFVARGYYDHAARLYEETLLGLSESGRVEHPTRATTLNNLGDVYRSLGRYADAERMLQEALDLRVKLLGRQHPAVAQSLSNLGYLRLLQGGFTAAREDIEQALAIRRATIGDRHPHTANSLTTLGAIQRRLGAIAQAADVFAEAAEINRLTFGDRHQQYGASLAHLGRAEFALERRAKAELHLLKARMILEDTVGVNHRLMAEVWLGLAELDQADGRHQAAFPLLERALAIQKQTIAADCYEAAETLLAIGRNLLARQSAAGAVPRLAEADRFLSTLPDPPVELLADVLQCEARAALDTGSPTAAGEFVGRALTVPSASSRQRQELLILQGELCMAQGQPAEAERIFRELIAAADVSGAKGEDLIRLLDQLSAALVLQQRPHEAEEIVRRSLTLTREQHRRRHPSVAARLNQLGAILAQMNRSEEAQQAFAEATEMYLALGGTESAPLEQSLRGQAQSLHCLQRSREAALVEARADALAHRESHVLDDIL